MKGSKIHNRRRKTLKVTQDAGKTNGGRIDTTKFLGDLQDSYNPNFQWATDEEIGKASEELLQMRKQGLEFERRRDFSKSGAIAFRIREILMEINKAVKIASR